MLVPIAVSAVEVKSSKVEVAGPAPGVTDAG